LTDYYQPPPADDFIANLILHALASAASAWVPTTTGSELISLYRAAQADRASWDQLTSRFEKGHPKVTVGDDWMRMRHLARLGASKAAFSSAASAGLCHVSSLIDISHSARPLEGYAAEAMIDGCDSYGFLGDSFWIEDSIHSAGDAYQTAAAARDAIAADAAVLDGDGRTSQALLDKALWPYGEPKLVRWLWKHLKRSLSGRDENWDFWFGWYEDRLAGLWSAVRPFETQSIYVSDKMWSSGAKSINAKIEKALKSSSSPGKPTRVTPAMLVFLQQNQIKPHETAKERQPEASDLMVDVFISHSSEDGNAAKAVCTALEDAGIKCWIAPKNVAAGSIWAASIAEAINNVKVMVVIISDKSNKSKYVLSEVTLAFRRGITIVPFRIENVVPTGALDLH
jgi:TIR domain